MKKLSTKNLAISGLFLALGLLLPFLTGQIPSVGSKLLPMHIPVLICGFVCGWQYGLIVGLILPVFRSMIFGMPPMFPTAAAMTFELAAYGCFAGLFYRLLPKKNIYIYLTLILSMVCGRIVWGIASFFLYGLSGSAFTMKVFVAGALVNALPGIVFQILVIPVIVIILRKQEVIKCNTERA